MSTLIVLSDGELDAVTGGFLNAGNGGTGGTAEAGANITFNEEGGFSKSNLSVNNSSATADGGHGGNVSIRVRVRL